MTLARRWAPWAAIVCALLLVSWRIIRFEMIPDHTQIAATSHLHILEAYNYTILLENYFTEGVIRRGLAGSLFYFLRGLGYEHSQILYHVLEAIFLCVPLLILLLRLAKTPGRTWIWMTLVVVLSPQLFMGWARDMARSDMLSAGFVVWALLACLGRRYLLAGLLVFVGSQAHETALAFGGSLLVAAMFLDWRAGKASLRHVGAALALLGTLWLLATAGQKFLGPPPQAVAHDMLAGIPGPSFAADWAIYNAVGGMRTLATSACLLFSSSASYLYIASSFIVLALYGLVLPAGSRLRLGLLLFAGVLPMIVLSIAAIDYGRWLSFAVLNWWLTNAALQLKGIDPLVIDRWPSRVSIGAALAVLVGGPGAYPAANVGILQLGEKISKHDVPPEQRIDSCDPTWRSVVNPAATK